MKAADLVSTLEGPGPFIVFAPTNQAFKSLPAKTLTNLLKPENKARLEGLLKYHVMSGKTLQGQGLDMTISAVSSANVIKTVKTGNGTVYVINKVLLPKVNRLNKNC